MKKANFKAHYVNVYKYVIDISIWILNWLLRVRVVSWGVNNVEVKLN